MTRNVPRNVPEFLSVAILAQGGGRCPSPWPNVRSHFGSIWHGPLEQGHACVLGRPRQLWPRVRRSQRWIAWCRLYRVVGRLHRHFGGDIALAILLGAVFFRDVRRLHRHFGGRLRLGHFCLVQFSSGRSAAASALRGATSLFGTGCTCAACSRCQSLLWFGRILSAVLLLQP